MTEHVHLHPPHELSEPSGATTRRERTLELVATVLLSLATLGIAWSGYQAARWSGIQSRHYAEANTARALANRASTTAGQDRLQDLLNFNRWLDASTQGNTTLTRLYEARFRPEFRPAFQAWLLQDPLNNPAATPSPLLMPQYHPAETKLVNQFEQKGNRAFNAGRDATEHTDGYVFTTVFFAAVLFFAGISMRFAWLQMRLVVLGLGALCLVYAVVRVLSLPIG
ncbi:MAG TPA: hypothetical protein VLV81_14070 [Acidimicrobiia bacterium]|nr:hypothetical protein [Acidimicrobiia bacterium]